MFGFRKQPAPLDRFTSTESNAPTARFFVERATDGVRLLDGRAFPSSLSAYMRVSSTVREQVRIVDQDGRVVFLAAANANDDGPQCPSQRLAS